MAMDSKDQGGTQSNTLKLGATQHGILEVVLGKYPDDKSAAEEYSKLLNQQQQLYEQKNFQLTGEAKKEIEENAKTLYEKGDSKNPLLQSLRRYKTQHKPSDDDFQKIMSNYALLSYCGRVNMEKNKKQNAEQTNPGPKNVSKVNVVKQSNSAHTQQQKATEAEKAKEAAKTTGDINKCKQQGGKSKDEHKQPRDDEEEENRKYMNKPQNDPEENKKLWEEKRGLFVPDGYMLVTVEEHNALKTSIAIKEQSIEELSSRLSAIASDKLKDGNPNIADLSDKNRPTKLGEQFGELYDNEWSDAYEALKTTIPDEDDIMRHLLNILKKAYEFCMNQVQVQAQMLSETLTKTVKMETSKGETKTPDATEKNTQESTSSEQSEKKESKDSRKGEETQQGQARGEQVDECWSTAMRYAKGFRKEVALATVPNLQKMFLDNEIKDCTDPRIIKYINKSVELFWLMSVQDPPMYVRFADEGKKNESAFFKIHQSKGPYVRLSVWPAVFLYYNGPIVSKGYISGMKKPKEAEKGEKS